tara:strand:- start:984 stop:1151 length:168 start_codon:yes stop_codon:yes gene_type:complete
MHPWKLTVGWIVPAEGGAGFDGFVVRSHCIQGFNPLQVNLVKLGGAGFCPLIEQL